MSRNVANPAKTPPQKPLKTAPRTALKTALFVLVSATAALALLLVLPPPGVAASTADDPLRD